MAKICTACKKEKSLEDFYNNKTKPLGKTYECRECTKKRQSSMYSKEEIKRKNRKDNLKRKYGLTIEDYEQLAKNQNYKCAICLKEVFLYVDHCHKTGKIRKLLCRECNSGLGMFKDNPNFLLRAIGYLNE